MINKRKIAAITAVSILFQREGEIKSNTKVTWVDNSVGWSNQPRNNWSK
jgi:hypothetical protein